MSDLEHARLMIRAAVRDLTAIKGMDDPASFSDEVFGFHGQQAVEKTLKAWLSFKGVAYPKTHDIDELLALLVENGEVIQDEFRDLGELNDFAVQFRYEAFEDLGGELERESLVERIDRLYSHVLNLLENE